MLIRPSRRPGITSQGETVLQGYPPCILSLCSSKVEIWVGHAAALLILEPQLSAKVGVKTTESGSRKAVLKPTDETI